MIIGLIFPYQLFEDNPLLQYCDEVYLVEELLFFKQYKFHKQKIAYHRASMKFYQSYLEEKKIAVTYIDSQSELSDVIKLITHLGSKKFAEIAYIETTDNWLGKRIRQSCEANNIAMKIISSPMFLNTNEELEAFFKTKKRFYQTDFYIHQRTTKSILLDNEKKPVGGKWTYDTENRLKYPKNTQPPFIQYPDANNFTEEAKDYTQKYFSENYGSLSKQPLYPVTFSDAKKWLQNFLQERMRDFGKYEDAIVSGELILNHSVLTPMLNNGLLTPAYVVEATLSYAQQHDIPLNSLEGFIRQIIGWREFIRAVYEFKGTEVRTKNFWKFHRKIPHSFWTGDTGIAPIDATIKKILKHGYCHHIERLMVLGNFMLLCDFDPDEVYRWFMEMFIDSYDWVMVPNVYGMSQFADGGLMSTKPYISGSNYLMKMSNYQNGSWQKIWDALFWRFIYTQRKFFLKNPRMSMMVRSFDKMDEQKRLQHLDTAERFLEQLDSYY
jgi:deoxyribodipyrimidine photolyase-related protein